MGGLSHKPTSAFGEMRSSAGAGRCITDERPNGGALVSMIEGEVIPRLLHAHCGGDKASAGAGPFARAEDLDAFTHRVLREEAASLGHEVIGWLDAGVTLEAALLHGLAPTARRLGALWDDDRCTFAEVTIALGRLQRVMRAASAHAARASHAGRHSILLAPGPGDQHTFGVLMAQELFERAGWIADAVLEPTREALLSALAARPYDVLGVSVSIDAAVEPLAALTPLARAASANPDLVVLLGGAIAQARPEIATKCAADAVASDGASAIRIAAMLTQSADRRRTDAA